MAIYSQALQDLVDQLAQQVADLQTAIGNSDSAGISSASDAIAQTASDISANISNTAVTGISPDDTQILYYSTLLTDESSDLQTAIGNSDDEEIANCGLEMATISINMSLCMKAMSEWLPSQKPITPPDWYVPPT